MKANPVGWFEIYVADMARARRFYEAVFGGTLQHLPAGGLEMYAFPMDDSTPGCSGALVKIAGVDPGGSTMVYFSCDDCAVEQAKAVQAGGTVFKPKFSVGPYGFVAIVVDTEGNMVGLHSMK